MARMVHPRPAAIVLLATCGLSMSAAVHAQPARPAAKPPPQALNWAADDGTRVANLETRGDHSEGTHVVVWVPAGSMSGAERQALVERLDRGVRALRELIGTHEWQIVRDQKITYYVSADQFISHATGRAAVLIPLARLQDGRAPFLHEAGHELLARASIGSVSPQRRIQNPLWLMEGLADYVGQTAAAQAGMVEGDVFAVGGLGGVDRTCATRLGGPIGEDISRFMGAPGGPPALFTTDRQTVAPTFYACAFSFTKFLVGRIGLQETIALMPLIPADGVHARIESLATKPMSAIRAEWLAAIK